MSSKFNINVTHKLQPFKDVLGDELFTKVVNDTKAFIGREEAANGKEILGSVKISAKCILTAKNGAKLALPLNNPRSVLLRFGMQITELDEAMGTRKYSQDLKDVSACGIAAELPAACVDWIAQERREMLEKQAEAEKAKAEAEKNAKPASKA